MKAALALALVLGACEENNVCGAACLNSLDVALHAEEWPAGEYVLVARYDAYGRSNVYTCTFTLPAGTDAMCDDDERYQGVSLSVGATVTLHLPDGPTRLALELEPPEGETRTLELTPPYDEHELCGQTCRNGSMTVSLDDEVP